MANFSCLSAPIPVPPTTSGQFRPRPCGEASRGLLADLKSRPIWLLWRAEPSLDRTKKPLKVPYYSNGTRRRGPLDEPEDRQQLVTFEEAVVALERGSGIYAGLAIALGPDGRGGYVQGCDLDDIAENGLSDVANRFIRGDLAGKAYVEISPSGHAPLPAYAAASGRAPTGRMDRHRFDEAIWFIPAERMKMRRPHRVPLSRHVIEMLKELHEHMHWWKYLFPCPGKPRKAMSENAVNQGLRKLGYTTDQMTTHGLRAMAATLLNEMGEWDPDAIERQLAHVDTNQVRRAYARGEYWDERVRMMQHWSDYLDQLRDGERCCALTLVEQDQSVDRRFSIGEVTDSRFVTSSRHHRCYEEAEANAPESADGRALRVRPSCGNSPYRSPYNGPIPQR